MQVNNQQYLRMQVKPLKPKYNIIILLDYGLTSEYLAQASFFQHFFMFFISSESLFMTPVKKRTLLIQLNGQVVKGFSNPHTIYHKKKHSTIIVGVFVLISQSDEKSLIFVLVFSHFDH